MLAKEKGIDPAVLIEKIQTALVIAIKKEYPRSENIKFDIDIAKGKFDVAIQKEVAAEVEDDANQISMEEAKTHTRRKLEYGDIVAIKLDTQHFGRIAAQTAKQVIKQGLKEIEREQLVAQWGGLQDEAVTVTVLKTEPRTGNATVNLKRADTRRGTKARRYGQGLCFRCFRNRPQTYAQDFKSEQGTCKASV